MSFALELRGVSKHFRVGTAGCMGTVHALRDVDLQVRAGEAVAVIGAAGAGKSTLLLCAGGLLQPDAGEIRRFGSAERSGAVGWAAYHFAGSFGPRARVGRISGSTAGIHLVDGPDARRVMAESRIQRWLAARCAHGDAVVIAAASVDEVRHIVSRTITLRAGKIQADAGLGVPARVAESPDSFILAAPCQSS